MRRRLSAALWLLLLGLVLAQGVRPSGADFVAASANPGARFETAPVFNTVSASLADPGTPLRGAVALSATAGSDHPLTEVRIQRSPAGAGSWSDVCSVSAAPYGCTWATGDETDGLYDLRAIAADDHGYSRTSAVVANRRVDNTAPVASLADPGSPLKGTVALAATASDGGSGLASVTIQRRPSGDPGWTDVCTRATSPASCSLDTATIADGEWDFRAFAADAAGNTSTSTVTGRRRVDNTAPTVTMTDPGPMRGTVTLGSTSADAGTGVASVRYEYRTAGGGTWTTACTGASAPFSCDFTTAAIADGLYDLRAVATDGGGLSTTSAQVSSVRIDNAAPTTVTMADPGASLQGTVALSGAASDGGSGIASVRFQYAPAGTTSWSDACTDAVAPFASCNWNTALAADGVYDLRALAVDAAGNTAASATRTARRVDNAVPSVTLADPGSPLRASVTLTATASDGGGIASVTFHRRPASGGAWTQVCSDTAAPYQCALNTAAVADGSYDLMATATDNAGRTASSVVTARVFDNTGPRGSAVSSTSGGATGTLSSGDQFVLTYTEAVAPASLVTGWSGASRAVSLAFSRSGAGTAVAVTDTASGSAVPVGALIVDGRWTRGAGTATFAGTMSLSGGTLTLTLGTLTGGNPNNETSPTQLDWTNSASVTDLAGNAGAATAVGGTGSL